MTYAAVFLRRYGGPDAFTLETYDPGAPATGEVQVRHSAIGINYIDIFQRKGLGRVPLPATLGLEAAGVVEAIGAGVKGFTVGDRVAYATAGPGTYAAFRNVPAEKLVALPDSLSADVAAALLFKGLTAQNLLRRVRSIGGGDVVVVHAAAGGLGTMLVQWAAALGATVVGTTTNPDKAEAILAAGAVAAAVTGTDDLGAIVRAAASGRGATVVYDSVGADTFDASIDALDPGGLLAIIGAASGPVPPIDVELLNRKGGLFLARPSVFHVNMRREGLAASAADLFAAFEAGHLAPVIGANYPLAEVAQAHRDLEAKRTSGSLLLIP